MNKIEKYDVIIFAGYTERDNLVCELENVPKKGFLKLGDKTFLEIIVEQFVRCEEVGDIYISGMAEGEWETDYPVIFNEDSGSMFKKAFNVYKKFISTKKDYSNIILVFSIDGPLITAEIISDYIKKCKEISGGELDGMWYYPIVKKEIMEAKFPKSARTYAKLKEMEVCGGDLAIINIEKMLPFEKLIDDLTEKRKNVLSQLIILNPFLVLKFLLKRLTLEEFMNSINKRIFKVDKGVRAVICEYAEIAMDVDKPHQLEEVRWYYTKVLKKG